MSTTRLALLGCLVAPSIASAQVMVAGADRIAPEVEAPRRVEGRVGMLLGGSDVGDADGFSLGIATGLGYRIGDVTLRARFDHYRVGDGSSEAVVRRGRGTRLGGALRYSFANTTTESEHERRQGGVGIDFWGELGAGVEHVAWRHGGVLDRPSGELAIGFDIDAYGSARERGRRRHVGYFMAFRSLIAQGPDGAMEMAGCGGPCDKATKPSRTDVSMFFEFGLHWGR